MAEDRRIQSGAAHSSAAQSGTGDPAESGGAVRIPRTRSESGPAPSGERQGKTTIAPSVVQKIAGIAAREISGVHAMGGGVSRAFGALRERIPGGSGTTSTYGVQVEVGEKQAAVDLDLIVEYGVSIVDLARAVRRNVVGGVEQMTGLEVIEVNISVTDIHVPSEGGPSQTGPAEAGTAESGDDIGESRQSRVR